MNLNIKSMLDEMNNLFGPLAPEIRRRLRIAVEAPTEKSWDDAYSIVLRDGKGFGLGLTLWQAVIAVDPTFPRQGPATDIEGNVVAGWPRVPDQFTIVRALKYASELP